MHYEVELMRLWRQLLKKDVMAQTHFFTAGGNSLLATKLAQDVEELTGVPLDLQEIIAHPTPEALAARLGAIGTATGGSRGSCRRQSAEPGANVARRVVPSAFADWGKALTCYTSALGVYLAADDGYRISRSRPHPPACSASSITLARRRA
jgi:hypothetical protein